MLSSFRGFINSKFLAEYIKSTPSIKNYIRYGKGFEALNRFPDYIRKTGNQLLKLMIELEFKQPQVTQRKSTAVKFIYRREKKTGAYNFRMDIDRNNIICLLNVPEDKYNLYEEKGWNKKEKVGSPNVYSKLLNPGSSNEDLIDVKNEVETMIKSDYDPTGPKSTTKIAI